jgi:hypothetical protein
MQFLHREFNLEAGDLVEVTLEGQANVLLMDSPNFDAYKQGRAYRYFGGHATSSPVRLVPPGPGTWHVVVDLGGYAGTVRAGVSVLRGVEAVR